MAFANIEYFSQSLKKCSAIYVLFPDNPPLRRPWSVFYLLHGMSDNQSVWMRQTSIERYVHNWPMMVVMPDGGRYCYTNAVDGGPAYEDDLIKDVMGLVERTFPVKAERSGRAIGGLSMGGYGAVKLGLKHPDLFASVHSHSGALGMARGASRDKLFGAELQKIFGPNAEGGPEDPFALIENVDHGTVPAMRIDCGVEDFLLKQNRDFHQKLESLHIAHEYQEFPGGHNWKYWDEHIREAIAFHAKNLNLKFDDREAKN
jgi:S-formylglutathione hydrolase FrmB